MNGKFLSRKGFTLVELLVSAAILSLLVLAIVQVTAFTGQAISINSKNLDAAGQARLVFDRMGADFAARINRTDLPMTFNNQPNNGNDSFQFYSGVAGYTGDRQISIVGYQIDPNYQLERGATGTDFESGQTPPQLIFLPNPLLAMPALPDTNYAVLAPGVFRMEVCYLIKVGTGTDAGLYGLYSNNNQGANTTDYSNVAAFVVAIAVLDTQSLKLVTSGQLTSLAGAFADTTEGSDPLSGSSGWNTTLTGLATRGLAPLRVCQNVHVYERTFYVP